MLHYALCGSEWTQATKCCKVKNAIYDTSWWEQIPIQTFLGRSELRGLWFYPVLAKVKAQHRLSTHISERGNNLRYQSSYAHHCAWVHYGIATAIASHFFIAPKRHPRGPEDFGASQKSGVAFAGATPEKGSRERCLPFFLLKMKQKNGRKRKENKEKTEKRKKKEENGKNRKRHRSGDPFCGTLKIDFFQKIKIFVRDWNFKREWNFQSGMKFSSAPHSKGPYCGGNSRGRDCNFQMRMKFSSENEMFMRQAWKIQAFQRECFFSRFGSLVIARNFCN